MYKPVAFIFLFIICSNILHADEISFPKTEAEIIKALKIKDDIVVHNGITYESKKGRVYQVINGKKFRVRALKRIARSKIAPKAGALINFDYNSTEIKSDSFQLLDEFGKALTGDLKKIKIMIVGHTDNKGSNTFNQELSEGRANEVAKYLVKNHGVQLGRIIVKGDGETNPISDNNTEYGRSKNRRVEFIRIE